NLWRAGLGVPVHSLSAGWLEVHVDHGWRQVSPQLWIVPDLGSLPRVLAAVSLATRRRSWVRSGRPITLASPLLPCYSTRRVVRRDVRTLPGGGAGGRPDR